MNGTIRKINANDIAGINTISKPPKRKCSDCGRTYYRVNKVHVWTGRNIGHRYGWHRDTANVCIKCMDPQSSTKILGLTHVHTNSLYRVGGKRALPSGLVEKIKLKLA